MYKEEILVLDIETSGFFKQGGAILEIGVVSLNIKSGEIKEVFSSLLKEEILTEDHDKAPLGWIFNNSDLTLGEVLQAPKAEDVFKEVQAIFDLYPLGVTAFNKAFDFTFLKDRGLKFTELPCPMLLSTDICKLPGRFGSYKWPKVQEAFDFFFGKTDYAEKHRGLDDAKHEAEIVLALIVRGVFKINIPE